MTEECGPPMEGSVASLRLKNFMSFKDVTFKPHAGLNVVLGPNGSGKSSLSLALMLALGADPDTLPNGLTLRDLVKCDGARNRQARITVRLHKAENSCHKIEGELSGKRDKIQHWIDDASVQREEVANVAKSLHIDPGNMCQFLSQDIVREFPKLNAFELLDCSMKAVGDVKSLGIRSNLERARATVREKKDEAKKLHSKLVEAEDHLRQFAGCREELDKQNRIKTLMATFETYLKYKAVLKQREVLSGLKRQKEEVATSLQDQEDAWQKAKVMCQDLLEEKDSLTRSLHDIKTRSEEIIESPAQFEARKVMVQMRRLSRILEELLHDENMTLNATRMFKEALCELEADCEAHSDILKDFLETQTKWNVLQEEAQRTKQELNLVELEENELRLQNDMLALNNKTSSRMNLLRRVNLDAYQGVQWLENNRHLFKGDVHGPIMMTIQLRKPSSSAVCLEKLVAARELEAFACEDAADVKVLADKLRGDLGLHRINIVHTPPVTQLPAPPSIPDIAGFQGFVHENLHAPAPVMSHLCRKYLLHLVPQFDAKPSPDDLSAILERFPKFFIGTFFHSARKRPYSEGQMVATEDLSRMKTLHFDQGGQEEYGENIKAAMVENELKMAETLSVKKSVKDEYEQKERELGRCKEKRLEIKQKMEEIASKRVEISHLKKLLETRNEVKGDRKRLWSERKSTKKELVTALVEVNNELTKMADLSVSKTALELKLLQLNEINSVRFERLKRLECGMNDAKSRLAKIEAEFSTKAKKMTKDRSALEWKDVWGIPDDLKACISAHCDQGYDVAATTAFLDDLRDDLEDCQRSQRLEPRLFEDYREAQRGWKVAKDQLNAAQRHLEQSRKFVKRLRQSYRVGASIVVKKVNRSFSRFMSHFGYAGSVSLDEKEDKEGELGIKIEVKFRPHEQPCVLAASVQSGGEKSIVTALYLMSLDAMSEKVPIRVVDEINQGMDPTNERKFWSLLLESSKSGCQSFCLSPKIPSDVDWSQNNATFNICFNGAVTKKRKLINIENVIAKKKSRQSV